MSQNPYHFTKSKPKFHKNHNQKLNKELTCYTTKSKACFNCSSQHILESQQPYI